MALGGGTWLFQNKKLPGTYINFISKDRPMTDIADRGYAAMALDLDWGVSGAGSGRFPEELSEDFRLRLWPR